MLIHSEIGKGTCVTVIFPSVEKGEKLDESPFDC